MIGKQTLIAFACVCIGGLRALSLDPGYHTNEEIYQAMLYWQQLYPDSVRIDTIGYSQQDSLPIWAVKISDHVNVDEDEPTILFVGQVHAEEIIGVEIVIALMDTILTKRLQYPYRAWLQSLEIWLMPTANPEGHQVVMDTLDVSYRKNKHDLNLDGIFNFMPGVGGDSDGVDINRNFPLNWVHGDTFLQPGGEGEWYDYFRGFSPLSESENQALWDLGQQEKFSFSVVWHSSRTGNNSEKVFYPWDWLNSGKTPPDYPVINYLGTELANRIDNLSGGGHYLPFPTDSPRGNFHDSFYAYLNTIGFLIECGTADLQPPYSTAQQVISDNLPGAYMLLDRASGYGDLQYYSQITGLVKDAFSNQPIPAVVTIPQLDGPYLAPRTCDSTYGRYRRYVMPGTYDVHASLRGYYPHDSTSVAVYASGASVCNFWLQPKPTHTFSGLLLNLVDETVGGDLFIQGEDVTDTVYVAADGQFSHPLPEGDYLLIIDSPGYVVRFDSLHLDQNLYVTFRLSTGTVLFFDDFEAGLGNWTTGGTNVRWGTEPADSLWSGGMVATESPYANYLPGSENWIQTAQPLNLSNYVTASVWFQHWYYFEPGYDNGKLQASSDGGTNWVTIAGPYDRQDVGWGTAYATLDDFCGEADVRLRFIIWTDPSLDEQGWRLDDVEVMGADTVVSAPPPPAVPMEHELYWVFPNPFNSWLTILLELPHAQQVTVQLWDIGGRMLDKVGDGEFPAGRRRLTYRMAEERASGIYLLAIESQGKTEIRKVLYLK